MEAVEQRVARSDTDAEYAAWHGAAARADAVPPVFVVGCAKSGTTWVQLLLSAHPRVVIGGEGGFAWRLAPALQQALGAFNRHQSAHGQAPVTHVTDVDYAMVLRTLINARRAAYAAAAGVEVESLSWLGDKTPQHTVGMGLLGTLFPRSRFIHVVRDPRDAATSAWFHFGRSSGRTMEEHLRWFIGEAWRQGVGAACGFGDALSGRVHHVRYESLHGDAVGACASMFTFLDLEADGDAIAGFVDSSSFERLSGGRRRGESDEGHFFRKGIVGDWSNHLPRAAVEEACQLVEPLMGRFGYGV